MSASCRRPGCTKAAAVTIHYDPVSCQLWLDPITVADRSAQTLCLDHAERLSPPKGWVVVDRRGAQTTIVSVASDGLTPASRSAPRRAVRRGWGSFEEPTLDFTSTAPPPPPDPPRQSPVDHGVAAGAGSHAVDEPSPPEEPGEDEPVDDLADLLHPRGGLLGKAFEAIGDQRSALTLPSQTDE